MSDRPRWFTKFKRAQWVAHGGVTWICISKLWCLSSWWSWRHYSESSDATSELLVSNSERDIDCLVYGFFLSLSMYMKSRELYFFSLYSTPITSLLHLFRGYITPRNHNLLRQFVCPLLWEKRSEQPLNPVCARMSHCKVTSGFH